MSDTLSPPQTADVAAQATSDASAAATDTRENWLALLDQIGEDAGYFEALGKRHWAFFVDENPTLLVTFEQADDIRARPGQMPLGHDIAKEKNWSHLCLIADGDTWYRDQRVYGYFDRLVDDAFFEDFDSVLFMGSGVQGYAAAAFSVAAPGATVITFSPRATQSPDIARWDRRALSARKLDFKSRYGYAPDMIDGAGKVFLLHDPEIAEDAMHAALFRADHVTHLHCPRLGGRLDWSLSHMQIITPLVQAAMAGSLTRHSFAQLWRARRNFGPYLRGLLTQLQDQGRTHLEKVMCQNVSSRLNAPRFRKRLADILAAEAEASLKEQQP